jgi:hypothetical protein
MQTTSGYSFWLLPDRATSDILSTAIRHLSEKLISPEFIPHITLSSVNSGFDPQLLLSLMKQFSSENKSTSVHAKDILCGKPPFQSYYISLEESLQLLSYSKSMDQLLDGSYSRKENFHISLYYGNESCKKIGDQFDKMELEIPDKMYIQSIALVDNEGATEEWEILGSMELVNEAAE